MTGSWRFSQIKVPALVILFILFLGFASSGLADEEIRIEHRFTGKIADSNLASALPRSGIINDQAAWEKLWTAWRPNEPIKPIDFKMQIVLVKTEPGPNTLFANILKLNEQGELKYVTASLEKKGPGFGYLIMVVPRNGIKAVNGMTLDGKPFVSKPIETHPKNATPANQPNVPPTESNSPAEESQPSMDSSNAEPSPFGQDFINVEIVGRVRSQFQSFGSETTGTLVAADGIVWELDLQQNEQFLEAARQLGNSLARITGRLNMERQRGSAEARIRWIVRVDSFESLGIQPAIPLATMPSEDSTSRPINSPASPTESLDNPVQGDPDSPRPGEFVPKDSNSAETSSAEASSAEASSAEASSAEASSVEANPESSNSNERPMDSAVADDQVLSNFTVVSLVTSDGQQQTIHADGLVRYESIRRKTSSEWNTDRSTIAKLHQFVGETEWSKVPKVTRSNSDDPNEIGYTISIETAKSVTRIYIDRTAVADQPTFQQFFGIISEIARNRTK